MQFEWDEEKNRINIRKHGLDFADTWEIFTMPVLAALDDREDYGRPVDWDRNAQITHCGRGLRRTRRRHYPHHFVTKGIKL